MPLKFVNGEYVEVAAPSKADKEKKKAAWKRRYAKSSKSIAEESARQTKRSGKYVKPKSPSVGSVLAAPIEKIERAKWEVKKKKSKR